MSRIDWSKKLGWSDEQFEELRVAGYSYIRQGKYDIALSFFEALNVLDSENAYDAQTLGALLLQLNQPARALKYFDKALKLESDDHSFTLMNITKAFFMIGKKDEALKLANILKNEKDPRLANMAKALILAFG